MQYPRGKELACSTQKSYVRLQEDKSRKPFYEVLDTFISLGSTDLKEGAPKLYSAVQCFIKFIFYITVIDIVRIP